VTLDDSPLFRLGDLANRVSLGLQLLKALGFPSQSPSRSLRQPYAAFYISADDLDMRAFQTCLVTDFADTATINAKIIVERERPMPFGSSAVLILFFICV
jgi:hypothetical protein